MAATPCVSRQYSIWKVSISRPSCMECSTCCIRPGIFRPGPTARAIRDWSSLVICLPPTCSKLLWPLFSVALLDDQLHAPVGGAAFGGVVVADGAGVGIAHRPQAVPFDAVGLEVTHHTAGACARELPVGRVANIATNRHAIRVTFHSDLVLGSRQDADNAPQDRQPGAAEISLTGVEQNLAIDAEADGALADDHLHIVAQIAQRKAGGHFLALRHAGRGGGGLRRYGSRGIGGLVGQGGRRLGRANE